MAPSRLLGGFRRELRVVTHWQGEPGVTENCRFSARGCLSRVANCEGAARSRFSNLGSSTSELGDLGNGANAWVQLGRILSALGETSIFDSPCLTVTNSIVPGDEMDTAWAVSHSE